MDLPPLGTPSGPMVRVGGGYANRLYRLDTDLGSFAVKEMNIADRRWAYRAQDVLRFERAAFTAGIPMPEPVLASDYTVIHRWVDGMRVPEAPVSRQFGSEIGQILARLHTPGGRVDGGGGRGAGRPGLASAGRAGSEHRATVGR